MSLSFEEALKLSNESKKSVLLGNGFSIAFDEMFQYQTLLEKANIEPAILDVFNHENTSDFELIINRFEGAANLVELISPHLKENYSNLVKYLKENSETLKIEFSDVISRNHPTYADFKERNCSKFLSNFDNIFTTNYDLLLYWAIMREHEERQERTKAKFPIYDGFGRKSNHRQFLIYMRSKPQNVFYLHGSLFLSQNGFDTIKEEQSPQSTLLEIISNNIKKGTLPLIILEGDSDKKRLKISEHAYLNDALERLSNIEGSLFIYGHSLSNNDQHIVNAINNGKNIKQIFISVMPEDDTDLTERTNRIFNGKEILMYDATTANVWNNNIQKNS